jgi:hypothetical protein
LCPRRPTHSPLYIVISTQRGCHTSKKKLTIPPETPCIHVSTHIQCFGWSLPKRTGFCNTQLPLPDDTPKPNSVRIAHALGYGQCTTSYLITGLQTSSKNLGDTSKL